MFPAPTLSCFRGWRWVGVGPCWARGSGCGLGCCPAPARGVRLGVVPSRWGAPRSGSPRGAGSPCLGWRAGGGRVGRRGGRRRRGSLGRLPPGWPPGPGWSPGCAGWCRRCGGTVRPGPRVLGGAAVPLRGCVGRRVWPVQRLVVRGVMGGVVLIGGGGHRCRVWGPVMGFLLAVAGGGIRGGVCRRGHRRQLAGAGCRVLRPRPGLGGGAGVGGVGVALLVVGGWGWVLCWLGVWACGSCGCCGSCGPCGS